MKRSLIPSLFGFALIAVAFGVRAQQQSVQRADVRDVAGLRAELDSVRVALARASAAPDSARLAQEVTDRTYRLGRREFHIAPRQESIDGWWRLSGPGTLLTLGGMLLVTLAVVRRRGASET